MTEAELNSHIATQLAEFGLSVTVLPKRESIKTADLRATDTLDSYVIEAKCRDRSAAVAGVTADLAEGQMVSMVPEPLAFRNTLSSLIRDAVEQLSNTTTSSTEFRLLWLQASSDDPVTDRRQFEATLCGEVQLWDIALEGAIKGCYFFQDSEFFRCRNELDGAFVGDDNEWLLILNPHSPRYFELKASGLVRSLGAVAWDPPELELQGKLLIADCDIARADSAAVLAYVCEKYRSEFRQIELNRYGGYLRIV